MAGGFPPQLIEEIRSRVDLVDLIGQFVPLRRAGENWKARCPFHAEKTPSFMVNPKKGIFHCFGCGAGGDAFGFLMRQDRLSFPEAVRALAKLAGVPLPEERRAEADGQREALYRALDLAARFYAEVLWSRPEGAQARQYLTARKVDPEVARRFGLGYAPEGWDHLLTFLKGSGVSEELQAQAGLALPRQTGSGFYDRFRGRLIFAIRDPQGRPIAFGGRALGSEEPKYLNSPETPLFVKGATLYALDLARSAIREKNRALIVEGYLDCLMAHQHGFTETVAALGTAFTAAQLALLRRYSSELIMFFDADAAGQKASKRQEELIGALTDIQALGWAVARTASPEGAEGVRIKVALLPPGHDPDSFLRAQAGDAFAELIRGAQSVFAYALNTALAGVDATAARGKGTAFAQAALILAKVTSAQEATELARQVGLRLGIDPTQIWIEAQRVRGSLLRKPAAEPARESPPPASGAPPAPERDLLALLVHVERARADLLPHLETDDLAHRGLGALLRLLKERAGAAPEALMPDLAGRPEQELLAALLMEERAWPEPDRLILEYRKRYEIRRRLRRIRQITQAIAQAQAAGTPVPAELEAELRELERQAMEVRELAGRGRS